MLKVLVSLALCLSQTFFPTCLFLDVALLSVLRTSGMCDLPPYHVNFILCVNSATSFTVVSQGSVKSSQALKRLLKLERTRFARYLPIKVKTIQGQWLLKLSFRKCTLANFSSFNKFKNKTLKPNKTSLKTHA